MKHQGKGGIPFAHGSSEHEGKAWGHGSHANMPQDVHMQEVPKHQHHQTHALNDTMSRLDKDAKAAGKAHKSMDKGMY